MTCQKKTVGHYRWGSLPMDLGEGTNETGNSVYWKMMENA